MGRLAATCALLIALGAIGCGSDDGPQTFDEEGFPFTFEYPDDFDKSEDVEFEESLGGGSDEDIALIVDTNDGLILQRITLNREVDASNLKLAKRELDGLLAQGGPDAPVGTAGETVGFPSLSYEGITSPAGDTEIESDLLVLFEGDQEYVINCQSTEQNRDEVTGACEQMRETLAPKG
jgi:hypothetical protein